MKKIPADCVRGNLPGDRSKAVLPRVVFATPLAVVTMVLLQRLYVVDTLQHGWAS